VLVVVGLAVVLPTILVSAIAVWRARRDLQREVVRGHLSLVRALGAGLDGTLQDARRTLALAGAGWADAERGDGERVLRRVRRDVPMIRRATLLDAAGAIVAGDAIDTAQIERAGTYGGYVSDVTRGPDGAPTALLVVQARGRTGELAGFVVAELDLSFVGQALALGRLGAGARVWVLDSGGQTVGWSGSGTVVRQPAILPHALAVAEEGSLEEDGVLAVFRNLSSYETVRGISWAVVLEQPTADAYALAGRTERDTALAGGLVLLIALAIAAFLANRLTRPLSQLAARVDALGSSAAAGPAPISAPGEIGALARRFEEMARRVAEREKMAAALRRGEQLASVGALAAGVAHEINNPLTTILGYASLLLEDLPAGDANRPRLELVADEARRVQQIVRTLLDHARLDAGPPKKEPLDANQLVERTIALLRPTLKQHRVQVSSELASALPRPDGDPRRIEQVLVNLAQNGAHAMAGGGTLTFRTAPVGAGFVVEVTDTGPGIPPGDLEKIFEPFYTTKGPGVGTGLGLAIARQLVEESGGRIEVASDPGHGATFRVILGAG
jgi:two-component system NtrC family sensor kinase